MRKIKVSLTFPVPPLNKGTLNSLKITEPSSERSAEQGTFGGSLTEMLRRTFSFYLSRLFCFGLFKYECSVQN